MTTQEQLSERLLSEGLVRLADLPTKLPPARNGKLMHRSVGWRWVKKGLSGRSGDRVKLEAILVGRTWFTSMLAVARFFSRLSEDLVADQVESSDRRPCDASIAVLAVRGLWPSSPEPDRDLGEDA